MYPCTKFKNLPYILKRQKFFLQFFQNKQSDQELNLSPTSFSNPKFTYFATFKLSEIKYYLEDLNPHVGLDPHNVFPLFLYKMAVFLALKLEKTFMAQLELVVSQYYRGQLI